MHTTECPRSLPGHGAVMQSMGWTKGTLSQKSQTCNVDGKRGCKRGSGYLKTPSSLEDLVQPHFLVACLFLGFQLDVCFLFPKAMRAEYGFMTQHIGVPERWRGVHHPPLLGTQRGRSENGYINPTIWKCSGRSAQHPSYWQAQNMSRGKL